MDLLRNAYSKTSDDESDLPITSGIVLMDTARAAKASSLKPSCQSGNHGWAPQKSLLLGRYVSKRERACMTAPSTHGDVADCSANLSSSCSTTSASNDLTRSYGATNSLKKRRIRSKDLPNKLLVSLPRQAKAVNALSWSPTNAALLASAGMDHATCIWNVNNSGENIVRSFKYHNAAVNDVKWSHDGLFMLSCGYDSSSRLIDVEKGVEFKTFREDQFVRAVKFHPDNSFIFASGGAKGCLRLWDIRTGDVVSEYFRGSDSILDLEFMTDGKRVISSSDISGRNISEHSIIVWDIARQVPLSNQIYVEAYTCPTVRCHPVEPKFVAQSNGNYIAIFSSHLPFKLDKYKRFESHIVSGFPIRCNFSSDGEHLVTGSSDGSIYIYEYRSSRLLKKIKACDDTCVDVAFNPINPNILASCSWNGSITVFQ